jgi:RNA polymerase sigma-70 factor (ECF subfamily)
MVVVLLPEERIKGEKPPPHSVAAQLFLYYFVGGVYTDVNEQDLIRRAKEGDFAAFRELFDRFQPIVFRRILFQYRDEDAAHDIVQETFVRIWERRGTLKPHLSFLSLAFRISENLLRDSARHRQMRERVRDRVPPPAPSEGDDPAEALNLSTLQEKLRVTLNKDVPERCRTIFILSRFEKLSNREIAGLLGLREKTVENQISHALSILRKKLSDYL